MDELCWDIVERCEGQASHAALWGDARHELARRVHRELRERGQLPAGLERVEWLKAEKQATQGELCFKCRHPCFFSCFVAQGDLEAAPPSPPPPTLSDV
jgi:hypothetical protein